MRLDDIRPLMGRAVIALAICYGGYSFLLAPSQRELGRVKGEIECARAEIAAGQVMTGHGDEIARNLAAVRAQAASLSDRGRPAREERELFDAITALATKYNVTVQQLTPLKNITARTASIAGAAGSSGMAPPTGTPTAAPTIPGAKVPQDVAVGYSIALTCEYTDLVRLIHGLERDIGYALVTSVRVAPVMEVGSTHVQGEVTVEFYALDASPQIDPANVTADATPHTASEGGR